MLEPFSTVTGSEVMPASGARPSRATRRLLDELLAENARLRRDNAVLRERAATEPTTGLAGRRAFDERLAYEWARAERFWSPLSLLLVSVDNLAWIGDHAGAEVAEAVSSAAAELLADCCRDVDLPFCLGAGELAVILPSTNRTGAEAEMQRLSAAWESRRRRLAAGLEVVLDFGLAVAFDDAQSASELLRVADESQLRARQRHGREVSPPLDDHPTIPSGARASWIDAA